MFKTILAPVDGSDHASKAVGLATDLAKTYGSKLIILHVTLQGEAPAQLRRLAEIEHIHEMLDLGQAAQLRRGLALQSDVKNDQL